MYILGPRGRLCDGSGDIGLRIKINRGILDIERQIDEHRPGFPFASYTKRLMKGFNDIFLVCHAPGFFRHRRGNGRNVNALKCVLPQLCRHCLSGNGKKRDGVNMSGVQSGDKIGRAGTRGTERRRHSSAGTVIAAGSMDAGFLMAVGIVVDYVRLCHVLIQPVDSCSRNPKRCCNPLYLHYLDNGFRCFHFY